MDSQWSVIKISIADNVKLSYVYWIFNDFTIEFITNSSIYVYQMVENGIVINHQLR